MLFSQPVYFLQDVFDLPFHMARNQIEESLRNKMASIKVIFFPFTTRSYVTVVKRELLKCFADYMKFEGTDGSIARCTKGSRGYF